MNASTRKILIFAFFFLHLSWKTSAAAIEGPEVIARREVIEEAETIRESEADGLAEESAETQDKELEVEILRGPTSYKCGNLDCSNGAVCEIKQQPDLTEKKITLTTQCRDAEGNVLSEETTTEDIPDGKVPCTSVVRKIVKNDDHGSYYVSSYAGSITSGNIGGENSLDFEQFDDEELSEFVSYYDKIMTRLQDTGKMLKGILGKSLW